MSNTYIAINIYGTETQLFHVNQLSNMPELQRNAYNKIQLQRR